MNAQISKTAGKKRAVELYPGGENLAIFFKKIQSLAADKPFSQYFDVSLIGDR